MRSLVSLRTSNLLKRCCRCSNSLRSHNTKALNSSSEVSHRDKDGSEEHVSDSDWPKIRDVYSEVASDIITTVSDGEDLITVDRRPKFAFYLPSRVKESMYLDGMKLQRLPTQRKLPVATLPSDLTAAMEVVLEGSTKTDLQKQGRSLLHKIRDRRVPMEREEWERKLGILYQGIVAKEYVDPEHPNVREEDRNKLLQDREQALKRRIVSELGNYKPPLDYTTAEGCQLYMYSRLSSEYATLVKAFSQLRAALPNFSPTTLLDFGSGVGSVTWAMDRVWPRQCKETVSIDSSAEMNSLNERLLRGGTDDGPLKQRRQHTYFRQFLPASATIKHNLVVMSRTLFELANAETRLRTLEILWKSVSPGGCLVLVEDGHAQACQLMLEARHFLLDLANSQDSNGLRIVAPCPHQFACPLLRKEQKHRICTDFARFLPYGNPGTAFETTFSYLAVHKSTTEESSQGTSDGQLEEVWPRIVQPVIKHSSVITVRVCNKFGALQELAVVKSKHGKLAHRLGKSSFLGDLFPVELLHPSEHATPHGKIFNKIRETRRTIMVQKSLEHDDASDDQPDKTSHFGGKDES